jgi:hypothetical protein
MDTMTADEENLIGEFIAGRLCRQPTNNIYGPRVVNDQLRAKVKAELAKLEPKQQARPAESERFGEFTNSVHSYRPTSQATRPESDPAWMRATTAQEVARLMGITSWAAVR